MAKLKNTLPNVHFGKANHKPMKWEDQESEDNDDDELERTPKDVKAMLGFDPKRNRVKGKIK